MLKRLNFLLPTKMYIGGKHFHKVAINTALGIWENKHKKKLPEIGILWSSECHLRRDEVRLTADYRPCTNIYIVLYY